MKEIIGVVFIIGAWAGFGAVVLSMAWHWIDRKIERIDYSERDAEELFKKLARFRDVVRIVGIIALYSSILAICAAAAWAGVKLSAGA